MVPALRFQDLAAVPLAHRLEGPIQAASGGEGMRRRRRRWEREGGPPFLDDDGQDWRGECDAHVAHVHAVHAVHATPMPPHSSQEGAQLWDQVLQHGGRMGSLVGWRKQSLVGVGRKPAAFPVHARLCLPQCRPAAEPLPGRQVSQTCRAQWSKTGPHPHSCYPETESGDLGIRCPHTSSGTRVRCES